FDEDSRLRASADPPARLAQVKDALETRGVWIQAEHSAEARDHDPTPGEPGAGGFELREVVRHFEQRLQDLGFTAPRIVRSEKLPKTQELSIAGASERGWQIRVACDLPTRAQCLVDGEIGRRYRGRSDDELARMYHVTAVHRHPGLGRAHRSAHCLLNKACT